MSNTNKDTVEVRGVSLYPRHWAIVEAHAQHYGFNNSLALRRIVDEWAAMQPTPRPEPAPHWDIYQPEVS